MSAINVVVQRNAVMIATDGIAYDADGVVQSIAQKCFPVPTANAVIASIGAGFGSIIFAIEVGLRFRSFDAVVLGIEGVMPEIFEKHSSTLAQSTFSDCEVFVAGWSESRNRGEAYVMKVASPEAQEYWHEKASDGFSCELFKLEPIEGIAGNPPPSAEDVCRAELRLQGTAQTVHEQITPLDLLHMLEIQRRMKGPLRPGLSARHWVGGLALLTTITKDCVTQRVLHRWDEDQIGEVVTPRPIDWKKWRAERENANVTALVPDGLSRLQRERMQKKARKGTLRALP